MARAAAFDLLVRVGQPRVGWMWLLALVALVLTAAGAVFLYRPCRRTGHLWKGTTLVALALLWGTMLLGHPTDFSVRPLAAGTVAVLMIGLAAGAGASTWLVAWTREDHFSDSYRLPPALRLLALSRFPVVSLVLVWALLVAAFDPGGFHDVRPAAQRVRPGRRRASSRRTTTGWPQPNLRHPGQPVRWCWSRRRAAASAPPCGRRWSWNACSDPARSPVATAPAHTEETSTRRGRATRCGRTDCRCSWPAGPREGASGWRRGRPAGSTSPNRDRAGTGSPEVDDILPRDYVASDLARLLSGDAAHLLLAQDSPDRAEVLERSWEHSWGEEAHRGLGRGPCVLAGPPTGSAGQWRIPVLAFNSSQVEDGCRFVSSPVDFLVSSKPAGALPVTGDDDRPDVACGGGRLGRRRPAVQHRADRLPVPERGRRPVHCGAPLRAVPVRLRPPAWVRAEDCGGAQRKGLVPAGSVSYAIDGGYFDNSGSATAVEAWRALEPIAAAQERATNGCVVPLFLQIDNSVDTCAGPPETPRWSRGLPDRRCSASSRLVSQWRAPRRAARSPPPAHQADVP